MTSRISLWPKYIITAIMAAVFCLISIKANASTMPYVAYSYDWWGDPVPEPSPYLYGATIDKGRIGQALNNPQDLFEKNGKLYIADTDNNRILIVTSEGDYVSEISDGLMAPKGVFVTDEEHIYVADSGNERILEYDDQLKLIRDIPRPVTNLIGADKAYIPTRLVVDKAGRIYTIAYGINMGLLELDPDGNFQGFMGAARVNVSPWEYIWKNYFSTSAQKQRMETIVPTEYSNIFLDDEGFIYASISNLSNEDHIQGKDALRRLNPTGTDVLRRLGNFPVTGDLYKYYDGAEWSEFVDVAATDYGCYFALDRAGGKVFGYDGDGNLLFVFGAKGSRQGMFSSASSLVLSDDQTRLYVLDSQLGAIQTFEITDYGRNLLGALKSHYYGDSQGADRQWEKVLSYNSQSEEACIGLGKTRLRNGDYKAAMKYFKLGNCRKYYSKAFWFYRKEYMQKNFARYILLIIIPCGIAAAVTIIRRLRKWVGEVKCKNI